MTEGIMGLADALFPKKQKNESITAPGESPFAAMHDEIKSSGIKPTQIDQIFGLVNKGVMPGTKQFSDALGIGMEQNGLAPTSTFGPFGAIRDAFSPKAKNIIAQQQVADKIGSLVLGQVVEMKQRQAQGPRSIGEANQILPGVVPPVDSQRGASLDQVIGQGMQGPTQSVDPSAALTEPQQVLFANSLQHLGSGQLMRTSEGIVPTSFSTVQGRQVTPEQLQFAGQAAITPPDQQLPQAPVSIPATLATKILDERGQIARLSQKTPDLNNRLESLTSLESARKYGAPMTFNQLAQRDPVLAGQLRQQAEINEQKDIYSFQQDQQMKRAIQQVGPVTSAKAAAERQQPVGGEVNKYARLGPNGVIERPQDGTMNQDQLNGQGFIDISRHQKEVDGLNDLAVIEQDFKKLKSYADELFTAGEGLGARLGQKGRLSLAKLRNSGAPTRIIGVNGKPLTTGELANIYEDEVTSMLEYYGRNLKGLRGAATEGDVARMKKNFAGDWTSRQVKDQLMGDTLKLIGNIKQAGLKTIFGEKVTKMSTEQSQRINMQDRIRELRSQGMDWAEIEKTLTKGN